MLSAHILYLSEVLTGGSNQTSLYVTPFNLWLAWWPPSLHSHSFIHSLINDKLPAMGLLCAGAGWKDTDEGSFIYSHTCLVNNDFLRSLFV